MTYDIHPILVHFPIALLVVYSAIKLLPMKRWMPSVSWNDIEVALLVAGVAGAFASLATGETAEQISRPDHALVETHSMFASLATWLYGALLAGEIVVFLRTRFPALVAKWSIIAKLFHLIEQVLYQNTFAKVVAFFALIAITVTGLLGGVMVYGTTADPIAGFVLKLLGLQ